MNEGSSTSHCAQPVDIQSIKNFTYIELERAQALLRHRVQWQTADFAEI
jgi:hypothetical protein